ncbi:MAG: AAA family ATPase [Solirubrobacterales bacterium]
MRSTKIEDFASRIAGAEKPHEALHDAMDDLESAVLAKSDPAAQPKSPESALGVFSDQDIAKMAERLTPEAVLDLSLTALDDLPEFAYRTRAGEYINFDDASAGQQATALLGALLSQPGPPLVIDQPEDDLDSQVVLEIVDKIWSAKRTRQLIFTSHNANLVVNGDAELVICCDYRSAGDQSGGRIKLQGAIDIPELRKEISLIMEGGEKAFRLRKEKYGF